MFKFITKKQRDYERLIDTLKNTINSLEDEIFYLKEVKEVEQEKNRLYLKDLEIILKNNAEQRHKIVDLENNIEFLYNNLSKEKQDLIKGED